MWQEIDNKLVQEFSFKDFKEAFAFMTRVAVIADEMNHHPDRPVQNQKLLISRFWF
jgi:4a-hydroxytetrahydrobiopterin dehydratase